MEYSYLVFSNYANGHRGFIYCYDMEEARLEADTIIEFAQKHNVSVEVGISEIIQSETINWEA